MALFGKRDGDGRGALPRDAAWVEDAMGERERMPSSGAGGIDVFLGKGTVVTGTVVLEGPGRIEGRVEGEIIARDALTIGDGAVIQAKITGTTTIIEGRVTGDVTATQRLEVRASGCVQGDMTTASLVVHEGATIDGRCTMRGAGADADLATPLLDDARDAARQVADSLSR
jgi:cytoskeletal protein CcmA (bactofilin family)